MTVARNFQLTALKAAFRLPAFSVALHQALWLCTAQDSVSIKDLVRVVERDVVMTGSLISLANSAFYGRRDPIVGLRHAIVRLGIRKTRNVILSLSIARSTSKIVLPPAWSSRRFNSHSLASALLSDLLVQNARVRDGEWAFVTGLLHDIGLLLIGAGLPEHFDAIAAHSGSETQIIEYERELLGFTHFEVGAEFLKHWNYPAAVQNAVRECPSFPLQYEYPFPLAAVANAATRLADAFGIAILGFGEDETLIPAVMQTFKISEAEKFRAVFESDYRTFQDSAAPVLT